MQNLPFLPHFPIAHWQLIAFAIMLLLGYSAGEAMRRIGLPRLIGYILVGAVLGESGLNLVTQSVRDDMQLFVDVGLGLLLYELGQRLDLQWMRRERWLWVTSIAEIGLTWLFAFTLLTWFDFPRVEAALFAAMVISTSPVVSMYMARELGADGQVTVRVLTLSALNSMAAFIISAMLLAWVHYEYEGGVRSVVLHPVYLLFGSFALGLSVFSIFRGMARWLGKSDASQFVLAMAMILLGVGLADALKLSVLCTMLTVGVLAKNADPQRRIRHVEFGFASELFCVVLFVSAGAAAHFVLDGKIIFIALALIAVRYLGKAIPVYGLSTLTPLGLSRAGYLSLALTPMSAFSALLVLDTTKTIHQFRPQLLGVFLSAVVILEIAGPLLVQFALRRARENAPEH